MSDDFDKWSLMTSNEALDSIEKHLKKVREKADEDKILEAEEKIKKEIQKSNDLSENYFVSEEDLRQKKIKDSIDKYFDPIEKVEKV